MTGRADKDPMTPRKARVLGRRTERDGVVTLDIVPEEDLTRGLAFRPGQFNMLTVFGVGEAAISISGDPAETNCLVHTVRGVGAVTRALTQLEVGAILGLRGPFGTGWPIVQARGQDVIIVAGGVGLAPLRPAILSLLAERQRFGKLVLLYGARSPDDILFHRQLESWRHRFDIDIEVTVDHASTEWHGHVGVVTTLIGRASFDAQNTIAFVCGPEIMMRFTIKSLEAAGIASQAIYLSMERNMKCAVGLCGHCQFGPSFICRDGPVMRYDRVRGLIALKEI
jgi:NAD(P)H-flavin reductase